VWVAGATAGRDDLLPHNREWLWEIIAEKWQPVEKLPGPPLYFEFQEFQFRLEETLGGRLLSFCGGMRYYCSLKNNDQKI
jgi:hypothetical protein